MGRTRKLIVGLFALSMFAGHLLLSDVSYAGGPPQPYYADYVMGTIDLGDSVVTEDLRIAACISGCQVYETNHVTIGEDGEYKLALHPEDRRLAGRIAIIYLLNDYGRVRANETVAFSGGFKTHQLNLTFEKSLPVPPDLPDLPAVGDEVIPLLPGYAIVFGVSAIMLGIISGKPKRLNRRMKV